MEDSLCQTHYRFVNNIYQPNQLQITYLPTPPPLLSCYFFLFINCNWVVTRWQSYSTHLHTNSTQNDTKQTIHRTTQQFGRVRAVLRLG